MIENIKVVRNPLTIIAIFAGLAEISGTCILPFITEANQGRYMWFLMIFPFVLVILFFLTLNFNPNVLYSPSDFRDEANYMRIFEKGSATQKILKIQEEVLEESEVARPILSERHPKPQTEVISSQAKIMELMNYRVEVRYQLAESLVIDRLTREFHIQPQTDMSLRGRSNMVFDAVFQRPDGITIVEVKLFRGQMRWRPRIRDSIQRIQVSLEKLPQNIQKNAQLIFAVVYDMPEEQAEIFKRELESIEMDYCIPVEVRTYSLSDLLKEIDVEL